MRRKLGYQNPARTTTLRETHFRPSGFCPHEDLKLTVAGCEALNPQYNVQQKDDDERGVKNIPHLSQVERQWVSLVQEDNQR